MTSGKITHEDKEIWWWNEEVAERIKEKKVTRQVYNNNGSEANKERLIDTNRGREGRSGHIAKAEAREEIYQELEAVEGQKKF